MCELCDYAEEILVGQVTSALVDEEGILLHYSDGRTIHIRERDGVLAVRESNIPTC